MSLIKHYTRQGVSDIRGPVTVVSGKRRRLQFIECSNDVNSMIDCAKVADLVLLTIDGGYGFELETFEFLNMLQVHGFPRVMGVLTFLDNYKKMGALQKRKKELKHRFWTEVYHGAKLFYISRLQGSGYNKRDVMNLVRTLYRAIARDLLFSLWSYIRMYSSDGAVLNVLLLCAYRGRERVSESERHVYVYDAHQANEETIVVRTI